MIRVFLVDPHPAIRAGIRSFLRDTEIEVVGDAESADDACRRLPSLPAEVLVTEINVGAADPWDYLRRAQTLLDAPGRVIVYAADVSSPRISQAGTVGVADYISKTAPKESLLEAIRAAKDGRPPIRNGEMQRHRLLRDREETEDKPNHSLTEREIEVLRLVSLGLSNRQIGQQIGIRPDTVKEHVRNILRKTSFSDRTQAAVWAVRQGIVPQ